MLAGLLNLIALSSPNSNKRALPLCSDASWQHNREKSCGITYLRLLRENGLSSNIESEGK